MYGAEKNSFFYTISIHLMKQNAYIKYFTLNLQNKTSPDPKKQHNTLAIEANIHVPLLLSVS